MVDEQHVCRCTPILWVLWLQGVLHVPEDRLNTQREGAHLPPVPSKNRAGVPAGTFRVEKCWGTIPGVGTPITSSWK